MLAGKFFAAYSVGELARRSCQKLQSLTHQWLVVIILLGTAVFLVAGGGDTATRLALPIRGAIGRIDIHVVHGAHANRDTRLDVAIGRELLVHGFIDVF